MASFTITENVPVRFYNIMQSVTYHELHFTSFSCWHTCFCFRSSTVTYCNKKVISLSKSNSYEWMVMLTFDYSNVLQWTYSLGTETMKIGPTEYTMHKMEQTFLENNWRSLKNPHLSAHSLTKKKGLMKVRPKVMADLLNKRKVNKYTNKKTVLRFLQWTRLDFIFYFSQLSRIRQISKYYSTQHSRFVMPDMPTNYLLVDQIFMKC